MPKVAIGGVADLPLFGVCLRGAVITSPRHRTMLALLVRSWGAVSDPAQCAAIRRFAVSSIDGGYVDKDQYSRIDGCSATNESSRLDATSSQLRGKGAPRREY